MSLITVEVVYCGLQEQTIIKIKVSLGSSILDVLNQSEFLKKFPEIDLNKNKIGVFSKLVSLDYLVQDGDRVEIYRPLIIDPKTARRLRSRKTHF